MKKNILLIVLCLACTATFAQRKKKTVKKKTVATKQVVPAPQNTALQAQSAAPPATAAPLKPFDRPLDGYYKKTNILSAKVTPYPSLREADVAYAKRIWREIDLRMKMNTYLASPKSRLIDVLMNAIADGELTAYDATPDPKNDPDGDSFYHPLTPRASKKQNG
jgi:hypothetical protein